jgi:hypothetical protein
VDKAQAANPFIAALMAAGGSDAFEVWPENWAVFSLFADMQTQWNFTGMGHRVGLQYLVLFAKLDQMGMSGDERVQFEEDVRAMELAALDELSKKD